MKKRIIFTWLCVCMVSFVVLAGCGGNSGSGNSSTSTPDYAKTLDRGTWDGDTYTNDSVGITLEKPSDWIVMSDADLATMMNVGADIMNESGASFNQKLTEMVQFSEMGVGEPVYGSNILVEYMNLELARISNITEEAYFATLKKQLEPITSLKYEFGELEKMTVSGTEFFTFRMKETTMNVEQRQLYRKVGKFMVAISLTARGEETIEDMLAWFK